jgi:hypothetical protein
MGLYKLYADAEYTRPDEGCQKAQNFAKRFEGKLSEWPRLNNQHQQKIPSAKLFDKEFA